MPTQYSKGLPKTTDPVALAEYVVKHSQKVATVDLAQFGRHLGREFGGMRKLAQRLKEQADNVDLPPRDRMRALEIALQFLQKNAELFPPPVRPQDLSVEQVAACIRYANSLADRPGRVDDPGDAFGH